MKLIVVMLFVMLSVLDLMLILAVKYIDDIKIKLYAAQNSLEAYKSWECPRCKHVWDEDAGLTSVHCPSCGLKLKEVQSYEKDK